MSSFVVFIRVVVHCALQPNPRVHPRGGLCARKPALLTPENDDAVKIQIDEHRSLRLVCPSGPLARRDAARDHEAMQQRQSYRKGHMEAGRGRVGEASAADPRGSAGSGCFGTAHCQRGD